MKGYEGQSRCIALTRVALHAMLLSALLSRKWNYAALHPWSGTCFRSTTGSRKLPHIDSCRWCSCAFKRRSVTCLGLQILVTYSALQHLEWDASSFTVANRVRFGLTQCRALLVKEHFSSLCIYRAIESLTVLRDDTKVSWQCQLGP